MKKRMFLSMLILTMLVLSAGLAQGSLSLRDGLLGYWPLDEGSGTIAKDISGNGHDGTSSGAVDWVPGKVGGAFKSSDTSYFTVPQSDSLRPLSAITVQCWVKMSSFTNWASLVSNCWDTGSTESGYEISQGSSSMGFRCGVGNSGTKWAYASRPPLDQWVHIVGTYDGTTVRTYFNGVEVAKNSSTSGPIDWSPVPYALYIGHYHDDDETYAPDATIDEVAIWDRALSVKEINSLYLAGKDGKSVYYAMERAWSPTPVDGAKNVPVDQVLTWKTGLDPNNPSQPDADITGHYVYLGTDEEAVRNATPATTGIYRGFVTEITNPSYNPGGLDKDTVYYWRVDERGQDDANTITGMVWSFETVPSLPVINPDTPADLKVFAGDTATFTVDATDPLGDGLTYQWYFDPNDLTTGDEVALSDGGDISGSTTSELSIANADNSNLGRYYCVVENAKNIPVTSREATLGFKELLARWPFDGNADEVTGNITGTNVVGSPGYVAGPYGVGQGISPTTDDTITLAGPDELNFGSNKDFTVSFWFNVATYPGFDATFISNKDWYSGGNVGWGVFCGYGGRQIIKTNMSDGTLRNDTRSTTNVFDGKWHLFCGAFDRDGKVSVYVDGKLESTGDISGITGSIDTGLPLMLGRDGKGNYAIGVTYAMSDVRFYNYPLNPTEVGQMWYDVTGEPVCSYPPAYDINNDCVVDLQDFAILANSWLNCGIVPVSYCP